MGRIECGGGEGGEPVLSPPGWKSYASWMHLTLGERAYCNDVPGVGGAVEACTGTSRVASPIVVTFHCRSCLASRPSATPHPSRSEFGRSWFAR